MMWRCGDVGREEGGGRYWTVVFYTSVFYLLSVITVHPCEHLASRN